MSKTDCHLLRLKSLSKKLSNENKHTLCFQRSGIFIYVLSLKTAKTSVCLNY